ncbi:translocation/assembly module TamB domain-containing protein [Alkalimonas sp.]|uniref:autotransporter assembly complex protein TamB n=1 Tax=Alkalimonas sp. TaxID=1872453 RepID=UPI00263AA7A0|nr:translocation/assembly module TamB domain-containing protein [Alkalimonas sp.]MCC5824796.1 translocation/assembly module TamB [Alkalimonas sp.]
MKWLLKLNKGFWYSVLLFVLLTVVLAFSQPGLRFNLWVIERMVPELSIGKAEGNLLNGFTLHQLHFAQEGIQLKIDRLEVDNHLPCLLGFSLCINKLQLDHVDIQLQPEPATDDAENTELALPQIWVPFPINIRQLQLNQLAFQTTDLTVTLHQFDSSFELWGNRLVLQPTAAHQLAIVSNTEEAVSEPLLEQPDSTELFSWQGLHLPELLFPLQVDMIEFQLHQLSLNHELLLDHVQFGLLLERRKLQLIDFSARQDQVELQAQLELSPQQNYPIMASLQLSHPSLLTGKTQVTAAITGDLSALMLQLSVDGIMQSQVNAELDLLTDKLPFKLQLQSDALQWPLDTEPEYQLTDTKLVAEGNLQQLNAHLKSHVRGELIPATSIQLNAKLNSQQLLVEQLILGTLGGQIHASGQLDLKEQLAWRSSWQFEQLDPGLYWPDYPGLIFGSSQLNGVLTPEQGWQLHLPEVQLSGWLREFPLRLDGQLSLQDEDGSGAIQLSVLPLRLHHGQNRLELQGTLTDQWQMAAEVFIVDFSDSVANAQGELAGKVVLTGSRDTPAIQLELSGSELGWLDLVSIQHAALSGELDSRQPMQTRLKMTLEQLQLQDHQLDEIELELSGTEHEHHLQLAVIGTALSAELNLNGQFDRAEQRWSAQWHNSWLSSDLGRWQLQQPLQMQLLVDQQQLILSAHCWQRESASLCLHEESVLSQQQAELKLAMQDFELSWLEPWLPTFTDLEGRLQANSQLSWHANSPLEASLALSIEQGQFSYHYDHPLELPWRDLQVQASLQQDQFSMSWQLEVTEQGRMQGQLALRELASDDRQLAADIQIDQFSFEFLQPLLDEYSQLSAILNSRIRIEGPLQQPDVTGHLTIQDVSVRGQMSPIDIEQGELSIDFKNDSAVLQGFVQTPQGQVRLQGDSQWADLAAWQAGLKIQGDALSVQIPLGRMQVQPDLMLTVNPERALISGTIDIPWARMVIDSLPDAAVSTSRDEVLTDENFVPLTEASDSRPIAIHTDIRVRLGDQVRFAAFGLRSHIAGSLQVRQDSEQPRLYGELNLVDGTFRSYGQDLLIRRGQLLFNGPADQPFLNLEAIRNPDNIEDDVIAGIRVSGPADEPTFQIFSEPAMAQANATSYLLLGRNLDSESGSGANPVTTSLIGLGLASSSKLVGNIGEAFGVQDLTLDTAGSGDQSQVTVSGYLTRNLQVKYGVGIFEPFGEFTLRYRLMRNLYLETVTGLEQSVDVLYRFEFD